MNSLVLLAVTDDKPGSAYFRTLFDVLEIELGLGMSSEDYRSRMNQDVTTCIEDNFSPSNLDDILDLIDLLIWSPCRDEAARLTVLTTVMDLAQRSIQRVDAGQLHLLRDYSEELGVELSIPLTEHLEEKAKAHGLGGTRSVWRTPRSICGTLLITGVGASKSQSYPCRSRR